LSFIRLELLLVQIDFFFSEVERIPYDHVGLTKKKYWRVLVWLQQKAPDPDSKTWSDHSNVFLIILILWNVKSHPMLEEYTNK